MSQKQPLRSSHLLAVSRLSGILIVTFWYLLIHSWKVRGLTGGARWRFSAHYFHSWAEAVRYQLRLEVDVRGEAPEGGVLLVPNHQSYLDIILLASVLPVFFVAKAEIGTWPLVGFLLRRADQLLIERRRTKVMMATLAAVGQRIRAGYPVCAFLEGTTTDGRRVGRFHSSLLQPAVDSKLEIVPVGIRWSGREPGLRISEDVAYWGDHSLLSHAWRLLGLRGVSATVTFGNSVQAEGNRRELASRLREKVVGMWKVSGDSE